MNFAAIDLLEVKVSSVCNLNCKACGHFSNITVKNEKLFYDVDEYKKDIGILKNNVNIKNIMLIGGEPLLNKNIEEFITTTRNAYSLANILIYTNGIDISKMSEKFFITARDNNILIYITLYPETIKYKKLNEEIMNKYGVAYEYFNNGKIQDIFSKSVFLNSVNNMYTAYRNCSIKNLMFLRDGKLYKCPTVANVDILGKKYNLGQFKNFQEEYGINIRNITNWKQIIKRLGSPESCCRYCNDKKTPWLQRTIGVPSLEDWVISDA